MKIVKNMCFTQHYYVINNSIDIYFNKVKFCFACVCVCLCAIVNVFYFAYGVNIFFEISSKSNLMYWKHKNINF